MDQLQGRRAHPPPHSSSLFCCRDGGERARCGRSGLCELSFCCLDRQPHREFFCNFPVGIACSVKGGLVGQGVVLGWRSSPCAPCVQSARLVAGPTRARARASTLHAKHARGIRSQRHSFFWISLLIERLYTHALKITMMITKTHID